MAFGKDVDGRLMRPSRRLYWPALINTFNSPPYADDARSGALRGIWLCANKPVPVRANATSRRGFVLILESSETN